MEGFIEWLKSGWEIICKLVPWMLQGVVYFAYAAVYFFILSAVRLLLKKGTVKGINKMRENAAFIIIIIISIVLAVATIEIQIRHQP